jgi:hypothetical protein
MRLFDCSLCLCQFDWKHIWKSDQRAAGLKPDHHFVIRRCMFRHLIVILYMYYSSPFSEPPSPWLSQADVEGMADGGTASTPTSVNRQSTLKMEADEALGTGATISSVLYANVNHPEWKTEFPGKFISFDELVSRLLKKFSPVYWTCNFSMCLPYQILTLCQSY